MNNRQKRLCRALLDFYDASGAQPYPLAQLAKKTGYHVSDIYDKDSQSGDLWPFDPRARGNLAGMLSFAPGKNPTVSITPAGLIALENLCKDAPAAASEEKKASDSPTLVPAPAKSFPASSKRFSSDDITDARSRFKYWLKSDPAGKSMLGQFEGDELVEAAFDKFFGEFLQGKEP
jgi:hypothetical protein